jgi:hypothetical protein
MLLRSRYLLSASCSRPLWAVSFSYQLSHSYEVTRKIRRDFRLPQRCRRDLPSSGILRSLEWYFRTEVSERPDSPIVKGHEVPYEGTERLSWKVGTELPLLRCVISQNSADVKWNSTYSCHILIFTFFHGIQEEKKIPVPEGMHHWPHVICS